MFFFSNNYVQVHELRSAVNADCPFLSPLINHLIGDESNPENPFPLPPRHYSRFVLQLARNSSAVGGLSFFPEKAAGVLVKLLRDGSVSTSLVGTYSIHNLSVGAVPEARDEARQFFPALHKLLLDSDCVKIDEFLFPVFQKLLKVDLFIRFVK